jgi:hypothetical protein
VGSYSHLLVVHPVPTNKAMMTGSGVPRIFFRGGGGGFTPGIFCGCGEGVTPGIFSGGFTPGIFFRWVLHQEFFSGGGGVQQM